MKIKDIQIGDDSPVFIIAELSANHNGSLETALETVKAAKRAGADCIKLQTYTADTITIDSEKDDFRIGGTIWHGQYLHALYQEAYTPWEWHEDLFKAAEREGIICFSSPFDPTSVELLESLESIRPGFGLHPKYLKEMLGKTFIKDVNKGERFELKLIKE